MAGGAVVKRARRFASWLASHFKRAGGASYASAEKFLLAFDRFLCDRDSGPPLQRDVVTAYLASLAPLSARSRET